MENKTILIGVVIVAVFLGIILAMASVPQETETMKIGYTPILSNLPLFIAYEKGYFEEEGINVELIKFEAPNQVNDALMQGQIDITCPGMALGIFAMSDYKNPGKIKVYNITGGTESEPIAKVFVPIDSDIDEISDLKGKKLGIFGGTIQWIVITKNYLEKNGLTAYEDVEIVELTPATQVQALAAKQIDALLALEPMGTVAMEQGIARVLDATPCETTISSNTWVGAGGVNLEYANAHPEETDAFIRAIKKGMDYIETNRSDAVSYLPLYTPITEELSEKVSLLEYRVCNEITNKEIQGMQSFYDLFTNYNVVDGKIDPKASLYCTG